MTIIDEIEGALGKYSGRPAAIRLGMHQFDRYCEFLTRLVKRQSMHNSAPSARDAFHYVDRYVPIKRMNEPDHLSIE
jgi:hypothetical protein